MKKLVIGILMLACTYALALNFSGSASLNGLQSTTIFTPPADGIYFINGQLTLPQLVGGSSAPSQAAALVKKNGSVIYTGLSGATGFQIHQMSLLSTDSIAVELTSQATIDKVTDAVRGQVYYGNTF